MGASYSREAVKECLLRWQRVLRLAHWDIEVRTAPGSWRKSGDIKTDPEDRKAVLLVNERSNCDNLDELVVHELLHLKLHVLDQMIEDLLAAVYGSDEGDPKRSFAEAQFMRALESTVEDLTKSLLAASGRPGELSFGRLEGAVKEELKGPA